MTQKKSTKQYSVEMLDWVIFPKTNSLALKKEQNKQVTLEPKVMKVLSYLIDNPNQVLTSEQIIEHCWPNQYLGDNPLHKSIAQIRKVLGDNARSPQYIKTIPKRGYQLIAPLTCHSTEVENPQQQNPYPGSRAFNSKEQSLFFGRKAASYELMGLISQLRHQPIKHLILWGQSGVGKTSLLNAAITPKIEQSGISSYRFTVSLNSRNTPTTDLINYLVKHQLIDSLHYDSQLQPEQLMSKLGSSIVIAEPIILIIDQLERIFNPEQYSKKDKIIFCQIIYQLTNVKNISIITAIKNDYYQEALQEPPLFELKNQGLNYDLKAVNKDELRDIIKQPADLYGCQFEELNSVPLSETILQDAINDSVSLAKIQYLLNQLYLLKRDNTIHTYSYQQLADNNFAGRAELIFQQLSIPEQEQLHPLLSELIKISFSGTFNIILKSIAIEQLLNQQSKELVQVFLHNQLLVSEHDDDTVLIRFANKQLLHGWPRIQNWLNNNYQQLISRDHLAVSCQLWVEQKNNKQLLLSSSSQLNQVNQLLSSNSHQLTKTERQYIEESNKVATNKRKFKQFIAGSFLLLSIFSLSMFFIAQDASDKQRQARKEADDLIAFMLQELKSELIPSGRLDVLEKVGLETLSYLQTNKSLGQEDNYFKQAQAQRLLGEVKAQQGSLEQSKEYLSNAKSNLLSQAIHSQQNNKSLFELGQIYYWLGYLEYSQDQLPASNDYWQQYFELAKTLYDREPSNTAFIQELSYSYNNLGTLANLLGNHQAAIEYFEQSASLKKQYLQFVDDFTVSLELSDSLSWIARVHSDTGNIAASYQQYQKQLSNLEAIANKPQHRYKLGLYRTVSLQNLANIEYKMTRYQESLAHSKQSLLLSQQMISLDQTNVELKENRLFSLLLTGKLYRKLKQPDLSVLHLEQAQELAGEITQSSSSNLGHFYLASTYYELAMHNALLGYHSSAQSYLSKAEKTLTLQNNQSNNAKLLLALINLRNGEIAMLEQKEKSARGFWLATTNLIKPLLESGKNIDQLRAYCLAAHYLNIEQIKENICDSSLLDNYYDYDFSPITKRSTL